MTDTELQEVKLVSEPYSKSLSQRQIVDSRKERRHCLKWLLSVGKDPEYADGYTLGNVKPRAKRMDQYYRWVWKFDRANSWKNQV